jgi:spore coat polysaccharide biosynthesis predicted glycosyltransferase SpsG
MQPRIVLRADASESIGIGHVMRSLTLGSELVRRGIDVTLATYCIPHSLGVRAWEFGISVLEAERAPADVFTVVDGYDIGAPPGPHAVIDDNLESAVERAALILNQNLHATEAMYADLASQARLLLGPSYALLRRELQPQRGAVRVDATRVVVAMGGADPSRSTEPILDELLRAPAIDVRVAIGAANPRRNAIASRDVALDRGDLVDSLAWADVAVIAAGTTLWEVGYTGVPAIAVVVADNQAEAAKAAAARGFVQLAERDEVAASVRALLGDPTRRQAMRAAGQACFDGQGAARVADAVIEVMDA